MMFPLGLVAWLLSGIGAGIVYFGCIWWSARQFGQGGRITATLALALLRLAVLGGLLTLASFHGAGPLLAMASGIALARVGMMRRLHEAAP